MCFNRIIRKYLRFNATTTIFVFYSVFLVGCTVIPLAPPKDDAAAKEFRPPADKAYIYVMREGRFLGHGLVVVVQRNGIPIARLKNDHYILLEVKQGKYKIRVNSGYFSSQIDLMASPGEMYFLKAKVLFGAKIEFKQLMKEDGKTILVEDYSRVKLLK